MEKSLKNPHLYRSLYFFFYFWQLICILLENVFETTEIDKDVRETTDNDVSN